MKINDIKNGRVVRFTLPVRISHWVHVTAFLLLIITGLPIYAESLSFIHNIFGGAATTKILHRVSGIIFIIPTAFMLVVDRESFFFWTKKAFKWNKNDVGFFKEYPKEFFGMHAEVPKQGFFNAGQKLNSVLTIFFSALMVCTGLVMWFKDMFPVAFVRWMYPLHDLGAAMLVAVIMGHAYLSLIEPNSRRAFRGMVQGDVDLEYAKDHHTAWYDEIMEANKENK